jgi:hypothetical protein
MNMTVVHDYCVTEWMAQSRRVLLNWEFFPFFFNLKFTFYFQFNQ